MNTVAKGRNLTEVNVVICPGNKNAHFTVGENV